MTMKQDFSVNNNNNNTHWVHDDVTSKNKLLYVVIVINYPFSLEAVECERLLFC